MADIVWRRRDVLNGLGGCAIIMGVGQEATAAAIDPVVDTSGGRVRGRREGGCLAFRGIRYAVADRFEAPRPPAPVAGVADAAAYGAIAPQSNPAPSGPPPVILAHLPRPADASPPPAAEESEDCLFLNIWTSSLDRSAKRPVMLWLHGGFFYGGSGASGDGSRLAARGDVVTVSINHRLNAFGYTHLADLAGRDFAHSGNLGMLDIVAALQWVRQNIEGFGGDPDRIMVFGESGGGMKTAWLMASPAARGLFSRAGVMSGPGLRMMERDAASRAAEMLLAELALPLSRIDDLRRVPVQRMLAAYHKVAAANRPARFTELTGFAPVIDPELLPHHPFDPAAPAQAAGLPLLIGSNADEMSFFMGLDLAALDMDEAEMERRLTARHGNRAPAVIAHYRARYPRLSAARRYIRAISDEEILLPTLTQAERKRDGGAAPVFAYHFDWESPALDGRLGATHTLEAPLLFGQLGSPLVANGSGAEALARSMADHWVAFAASGAPGVDWSAYGEGGQMLRLGNSIAMQADPFKAERALFSA